MGGTGGNAPMNKLILGPKNTIYRTDFDERGGKSIARAQLSSLAIFVNIGSVDCLFRDQNQFIHRCIFPRPIHFYAHPEKMVVEFIYCGLFTFLYNKIKIMHSSKLDI